MRKSYDYYNQNNRGGDFNQQQQQHDGGNKIEQRMQNLRFDSNGSSRNKANNAEQHNKEPKKMTWATIASQPAKPQINTTSTTIKKKGPGMPPPPMVPGKHNMELNDGWDTPKNGPLVPPSPPVITAPPIDLSLDKQNSNFDGEPAWPTPGQAVSQATKDPQQQQNSTQSSNNNNTNTNNNHNNNNSNNNSQNQPQHNSNSKYDKYDKYDRYENSNQRGYQVNNNQNNNYHGRQPYNSNNHQQHYNSSNYNDYQKPYHQHPHQMPTAPPQKYDQAPITRSMPPPTQAPQQSSASSMTAGSEFNKLNKSDENILEQLRVKNQYNPSELDLSLVDNAR